MSSRRAVLASAVAAQAASSLVTFGLPAIGPEVAERYGLSLAGLGLVLAASLIGSGVTLLAAGAAVDRYGGAPVTLAGTALATAGILGAAFAPGVPLLVACLVVSGIGSAAVPIAGMSAIFRVFGAEQRAWALGVRQMAVPLAGVVGAVLMPGLERLGGVRLALLVSAVAVAVTGLAFARLGSLEPPAERPPSPLRAFGQILAVPGMRRLLAVAFCYIVVLQTGLTFLVPSARDAGISAFWAAAAFLVLQLGAGVARIVWGRIADRDGGRRRTRTLVEAGWAGAAGAVVLALALHGGAAAAVPAAFLFAFGAMGWNALVYVSAGERAPRELTAQSVSVAATLIFTVSGVCAPPMGALADAIGWDAFWLVCGGLCAVGALVAAGLDEPSRAAAPRPAD